jgi:hypothetical protein
MIGKRYYIGIIPFAQIVYIGTTSFAQIAQLNLCVGGKFLELPL